MPDDAINVPIPTTEEHRRRTAPSTRPHRRLRRPLVAGSTLFVLVLLAVVGYFLYRAQVAEQELKDAIAEADRLDAGWRLEELEARRIVLPAEKNSATYVNKAGSTGFAIRNTGINKAELTAIHQQLDKIRPHVRVTAEQAALLRVGLKPLAAPLAEARKVAELADGRHPFAWSRIDIPLPHVDHANFTVRLLSYEGMLHLHGGDTDKAWVCCRASFNIARSLGDEPITLAQVVRALTGMAAIHQIERTLAQGHVGDKELADMQKLLQEELKHPATLIAARGERALVNSMFTRLEAGKISAGELKHLAAGNWEADLGYKDELAGYLSRHEFKPAHAWLLRYTTAAVEIVKKHGIDSDGPLIELQATLADAPKLARQLAPKFARFTRFKSNRALCECARAGLAAERYRIEHKRWPASLADLVAAKLLDEVPTDPYDGKPLRLRATRDGIVIYSVGPSGAYDGSALDANVFRSEDERLEFRLWNVEKR